VARDAPPAVPVPSPWRGGSEVAERGATSFFLAFFLDDMQRGDRKGAVNVGVYITGLCCRSCLDEVLTVHRA